MGILKRGAYLFLLLLVISCGITKSDSNGGKARNDIKIGVLADVHFHDVYGSFEDNDYNGITNPQNGKQALIRTMEAQLHSTRIFNENYFAFLAALDDLVKRDVKYIILPGDFSDDGQPVHLRGFRKILEEYAENYGLQFFLITGNHDVVEPNGSSDGKNDFLGIGGKPQPIMSQKDMYDSDPEKEHDVVVTNDIRNLGYLEVAAMLGDYGFFPKEKYKYWQTPFSDYDYQTYTFEKARASSALKYRKHLLGEDESHFPDISYVVEPVDGVWLLALDANVFVPKVNQQNDTISYPDVGLGYNNVLNHKKYLITWVKEVAEEAQALGKTLIAFSHYPMIDFNDGASGHIKNLGIERQMQLQRVPKLEVAEAFADAGIKIHFGGHMHLNDTGIYTNEKGNTLVNIQTPSPAAYRPGYKLATLKSKGMLDIQTIILDSVARFNELFDLYREEYGFMEANVDERIWNKEILESIDYHNYTDWHLKELVRFRFLNGWPTGFTEFFTDLTGKDLFLLAQGNKSLLFKEVVENIRNGNYSSSNYWAQANRNAAAKGLDLEDFGLWSGLDFITDLYRLRGADQLAREDIGELRVKQYNLILDAFLNYGNLAVPTDPIQKQFIELMNIFKMFLNGEPSDHIEVHLATGKIIDRSKLEY